ncbi:hypothetical protein ACHAWC_009402 [Mediolabrus comicus]
MINDDEFVEDGTNVRDDVSVSSNDDKDKDKGSAKDSSSSPPSHDKWIWLHPAFHCLVTMVGTGVLGFPYATSWLGFGGAAVLIIAAAASAYYTASLLSGVQEPGQKTYMDIATSTAIGLGGRGLLCFQLCIFFPVSAVMILLGGQALVSIDLMSQGATTSYLGGECGGYTIDTTASKLTGRVWTVIMGCIVLLLSMTKDMSSMWPVSAAGTVAVFIIVLYSIVGSGVVLSDESIVPNYDAQECIKNGDNYAAELLTAIGSIIFGYGFHIVLPDIQTSLYETDSKNVHKDMKKAIISAFSIAFPSYLVIALLGFAAFGVSVASDLLLSMTPVLSNAAMYVVWVFVIIKTATEGAVYNQSAFVVCRRILVVFWNKKHKADAPKWRIRFHYVFIAVWSALGALALAGAIWSLTINLRAE